MTSVPQSDGKPHITLSPFYLSARNEIVQPDKFSAHSHYLTRRWKRELGPTGYAILTSFRERCYYNRKTGEKRETMQVRVEEIAEECGVSERTVRRELTNNPALRRFIQAQREADPGSRSGGYIYGPSSYRVAMDDPLHLLDEMELTEIVRRKAEEAEKQPEDPVERARRRAVQGHQAPSGQSDRTVANRTDNLTGRADNLSPPPDKLTGQDGQIDRTLKSPDSSFPENTLVSSGGLASLFQEEDPEPAGTAFQAWKDLTDGERRPYRERAKTELHKYALQAGAERWARIGPRQVEVRAQHIYETEQKGQAWTGTIIR